MVKKILENHLDLFSYFSGILLRQFCTDKELRTDFNST